MHGNDAGTKFIGAQVSRGPYEIEDHFKSDMKGLKMRLVEKQLNTLNNKY